MTYPADWWTYADSTGQMAPGLRNRRRYALYQASRLAARASDPAWHPCHYAAMAGQRLDVAPHARHALADLGELLASPASLWVFKATHAVAGVHGPGWSMAAAPAQPDLLLCFFDTAPGDMVALHGACDTPAAAITIRVTAAALIRATAAAMATNPSAVTIFPASAAPRGPALLAELTGQTYPYRPGVASRSTGGDLPGA